jgi:hypothetical protein
MQELMSPRNKKKLFAVLRISVVVFVALGTVMYLALPFISGF